MQCFDTLTEFIQGPCEANQIALAEGRFIEISCILLEKNDSYDESHKNNKTKIRKKSKRKKYFVFKHANYVANYHKNLLKSVKGLLAIMGLKNIKQLDKNKLLFLDKNSRVHDNIDEVFKRKLDLGKNKGE